MVFWKKKNDEDTKSQVVFTEKEAGLAALRPFEVGMTLGLIVNDTKMMSEQIVKIMLECLQKNAPKEETIRKLSSVVGIDKKVAAMIVQEFWKDDYMNLDAPLKRRVCQSLKNVIEDVSKYLLSQIKSIFPPAFWQNRDFVAGYRMGLGTGLSKEEVDALLKELGKE